MRLWMLTKPIVSSFLNTQKSDHHAVYLKFIQ